MLVIPINLTNMPQFDYLDTIYRISEYKGKNMKMVNRQVGKVYIKGLKNSNAAMWIESYKLTPFWVQVGDRVETVAGHPLKVNLLDFEFPSVKPELIINVSDKNGNNENTYKLSEFFDFLNFRNSLS